MRSIRGPAGRALAPAQELELSVVGVVGKPRALWGGGWGWGVGGQVAYSGDLGTPLTWLPSLVGGLLADFHVGGHGDARACAHPAGCYYYIPAGCYYYIPAG